MRTRPRFHGLRVICVETFADSVRAAESLDLELGQQ